MIGDHYHLYRTRISMSSDISEQRRGQTFTPIIQKLTKREEWYEVESEFIFAPYTSMIGEAIQLFADTTCDVNIDQIVHIPKTEYLAITGQLVVEVGRTIMNRGKKITISENVMTTIDPNFSIVVSASAMEKMDSGDFAVHITEVLVAQSTAEDASHFHEMLKQNDFTLVIEDESVESPMLGDPLTGDQLDRLAIFEATIDKSSLH